jgi:hypothetical protein
MVVLKVLGLSVERHADIRGLTRGKAQIIVTQKQKGQHIGWPEWMFRGKITRL